MDYFGIYLPLFQFFNNNTAMVVGIFFPVRVMQQAGLLPLSGSEFVGSFFFKGPGFHIGRHLFHVQAELFIGHPFEQEGIGFFG